ncbi:MAG: hypothetical protein EB156_00680 [Euryarchaeota archaeon]|nr:hypothetical protein [Euryarchaeota archaeon]NDB93141.1 hypothetical protein [Euryarchaeota archaeon]NDF36292.1 hypothetical protein [Euryarchaeota archaeon]NDG21154.1 hypothetical protein [Euryarchaeota archaeon]
MILGHQVAMADDKPSSMGWTSMLGMAGMFVITICFGIFIQPAWNFEEAKAFGDEGSTEAKNIVFELLMILIFTALVIWLARKGLQVLIKWFVLFALWFSMLYATLPVMALISLMAGMEGQEPWNFAFVASPLICFASMVALYKYPEWWVVNSVGMVVGSGVIVMLGISFVPVLICVFMVLAAIYDYWAVHRSKHMLELADTMIDLKLPVVLVAPKDSSYSFREQEGSMSQRNGIGDPADSIEIDPHIDLSEGKGGSGRDALFMGLGDVIFPGMLVISSLTYMPEVGGVVFNPFGEMYLGQLLVATGTLLGGLVGYFALMSFVAKGEAQPGLPLLNGGAILGYIVSGMILVGPAALWQNISFF